MAVVATGFFDGVHSGHRLVIDTLLSEARAKGEESVVVTFWPHPRVTLGKDAESLRLLTSRAYKEEMILGMGVSRLETIDFSLDFASLSALDYIRMLRDGYGCTELILGYDTRFGSEQLGPQAIADLARGEGVDSVIVPAVCAPDTDIPVSSTMVRAALEEGDTVLAAELLGRPYSISGVVVEGNHLGRTLGFPTANMALDEDLLLIPRSGVYSSVVYTEQRFLPETPLRKTSLTLPLPPQAAGPSRSKPRAAMPFEEVSPEENVAPSRDSSDASLVISTEQSERRNLTESHYGMTNVGTRPTVGVSGVLTVETHIFDFDDMIYGQRIRVEFLERIRDERRFPSLDALRAQLRADAALIREED